MDHKYTKRLSVFFSSIVIAGFLSGIPSPAEARVIPAYILIPVTIHAVGYALPRINERLTLQQRQKIQVIQEETLKGIEGVLTDVQRSRIVQNLRSRQRIDIAAIVRTLRLTPAQKARIQSIAQASRERMNAIISPEGTSVNRNQKN
jgi:hypothetical protein